MDNQKTPATFRLSATARALLQSLALKKGVNLTSVIEIAVREMAERENITVPSENSFSGEERDREAVAV